MLAGGQEACMRRLIGRKLDWKCYENRGSAVQDALGPNPTAVPRDDALDGRQANSVPLEPLLFVEALERAEKAMRFGHVEADPVVANVADDAGAVADRAKLDLDLLARGRVLSRVRKQVLERRAEEPDIPVHVYAGLDTEDHGSRAIPRANLLEGCFHHFAQVHGLPPNRSSCDP